VAAIADAVEEQLEKNLGVRPRHVEGRRLSEWVLLDYLDFVVHVFLEDRRRFYGLERLWGDAPRVDLDSLPAAGPPETPVRAVKRLRAGRRRPTAAR
jgi:ribosome-associated protein